MNEEKQKELQEILSAARGALEEAIAYANRHDLWFEFTGVRRGPGDYLKTMNVNDSNEVAETISDVREGGGELPETDVDVLDISEEWVGSWC